MSFDLSKETYERLANRGTLEEQREYILGALSYVDPEDRASIVLGAYVAALMTKKRRAESGIIDFQADRSSHHGQEGGSRRAEQDSGHGR